MNMRAVNVIVTMFVKLSLKKISENIIMTEP